MNLSERLKKLRETRGWTKVYVAKKLGLKNHSTYSNWEYGLRQPDSEMLLLLSNLYDVSIDYLVTGITPKPTNAIPVGEITTIPIIGSIKAGPNGLAVKEHLGEETIESESIKGGTYFYLRVTGDSMTGAGIIEGDLALIREQDDCENGEIAAVIVNGYEATLKKVYKLSDGSLMLQAANPIYPDRLFTGEELRAIKIVGKLKEIKRKF